MGKCLEDAGGYTVRSVTNIYSLSVKSVKEMGLCILYCPPIIIIFSRFETDQDIQGHKGRQDNTGHEKNKFNMFLKWLRKFSWML